MIAHHLDVTRTREARSELRRWCPEAKTHQDADEHSCAWADHDMHLLRLRRMLICSVCEQGYFDKEGFDAHECHSAY